jgi:hypothetical protein
MMVKVADALAGPGVTFAAVWMYLALKGMS